MGNNNSSYFKKLINDYIIYVPEFQRNYLQGDDSNESIKYKRDRLLNDNLIVLSLNQNQSIWGLYMVESKNHIKTNCFILMMVNKD